MKKTVLKLIMPIAIVGFLSTSCKKCEECHYDKDGGEVELGELCGDDLKQKEKDGITIDGVKYEVHCHGH